MPAAWSAGGVPGVNMGRGTIATDGLVHGEADEGYGAVADEFRRQHATGREIGSAVAVVRDGRLVVDLWAGLRDRDRGLPWERDTIVPVFSTTKGMASIALGVAHSRGWFDFDDPVAAHWPEFARAGKGAITIRQLLAHQAGLAALDRRLDLETIRDPDRLATVLARQAPLWEPGTRQGYHAWTMGFYEGELVRRVDPSGRTIGRLFAEEVARPLGLDFHIGLPDDLDDANLGRFHGVHPVRGLLQLRDTPRRLLLGLMNPRGLTSRAFTVLPLAMQPDGINDREVLGLELAAVGGVGNARAVATAYGELAVGAPTLGLSPATLAAFEEPAPTPSGGPRDLVLHSDMRLSLGFAKPFPALPFGSGPRSYAMAGAGGSFGMADPELGLGFGYVPNRMGFGSPTDPREVALRDVLYRVVGGPPQDPRRTG